MYTYLMHLCILPATTNILIVSTTGWSSMVEWQAYWPLSPAVGLTIIKLWFSPFGVNMIPSVVRVKLVPL